MVTVTVGLLMCFCLTVILCAGGLVLQPHVELHSRPYEICHHISYNCKRTKSDFRSCVLEYARYAETLTVAASLRNANKILLDTNVIEALKHSIRRLTILSCSDRNSFPLMCSVAENFVRNGAVRELCIGHCRFTSDMLKQLLEFAATDTSTVNDFEAVDCQSPDKCDGVGESNLNDSYGNSSDLYDLALQPCKNDPLPSAFSVARCQFLAHSNLSGGHGIQALTLINIESKSGCIDSVLSDILPRLCQLKKLALIGLKQLPVNTVLLRDTSPHLYLLVQCGQLSHVIIEGPSFSPRFLSEFISAVLRRRRYVCMYVWSRITR